MAIASLVGTVTMSIQLLGRFGVVVFVLALAAGCSSRGSPAFSSGGRALTVYDDECRGNRRACIYEGSYEPGERGYAEEEAKRLNRAQAARIRRW